MSYFEALLYMGDVLLTKTHTSVQVSRAFKGCKLYSIQFDDCEYKEDVNDAVLHSVSATGATLEEAAEKYYNRIKDKLLIFHAYSHTRYEIPTNELIEKWEEYRKKEEEKE